MTDDDRCSCPSPSTCAYCSRMYPCDCAGCNARKDPPKVGDPTDDPTAIGRYRAARRSPGMVDEDGWRSIAAQDAPVAADPVPSAWAVISYDRVIYLSLSWSAAHTVAARERVNGIGAHVAGLWGRDSDQAFLDGYGAAYMASKRTMAGYPGFVRMAEYEHEAKAALVQWHKDIEGGPGDGGEVDPESAQLDRAEYP